MKKLFSVIVGVLALNFLVVAGGVGYLVFTKKLDRAKMHDIRDLVLNAPATTQPATQPSAQNLPDDTPMLRLEKLVAQTAGRTSGEQSAIAQASLEAQATVLEKRLRELEAQRQEIEAARVQVQKDRDSMQAKAKDLQAQQDTQAKQAADDGFQKSLALYSASAPKRVKAIFMGLDDAVVVRYLQAMEPRQAASVLKEFKTPEETSRAQTLLEKMRQAQAKAE